MKFTIDIVFFLKNFSFGNFVLFLPSEIIFPQNLVEWI